MLQLERLRVISKRTILMTFTRCRVRFWGVSRIQGNWLCHHVHCTTYWNIHNCGLAQIQSWLRMYVCMFQTLILHSILCMAMPCKTLFQKHVKTIAMQVRANKPWYHLFIAYHAINLYMHLFVCILIVYQLIHTEITEGMFILHNCVQRPRHASRDFESVVNNSIIQTTLINCSINRLQSPM